MKKLLLTLTLICFVALPSAVLGCWTWESNPNRFPSGLLITDSEGKIFLGEQDVSEAYVSAGLSRVVNRSFMIDENGNTEYGESELFYYYPQGGDETFSFFVYRAALDGEGVITDYELIRMQSFTVTTPNLYVREAAYIEPGYLPVGCDVVSISDDLAYTTDDLPCLVYTHHDLDYHIKNLVSFTNDFFYESSYDLSYKGINPVSDSIVVWRQQETETTTVRSIDFSESSLYSTGDALPLSPLVTLARPVETIKTYDVISTSYLIANAGQRVKLVLPGNIENLKPEVTTWDVDIKSATLRITDSDGVAEFYTVENPPCGKAIPIFGRYSINPWGIGINDELVIDLILSTGSVSSDAGTGSAYVITKPTAPRSVITVSALARPER